VGKGARFVVELDTISEPAPALVPPPAHGAEAPSRKPRILIVEDHRDTAEILVELLTEEGFEVTSAASAQAALKRDPGGFDLVVSDLGLPDASGLELMRALQARHPVKGIALSGYGTEGDVRASRAAGFDAHLTKPVDLSVLMDVIRSVWHAAPGA